MSVELSIFPDALAESDTPGVLRAIGRDSDGMSLRITARGRLRKGERILSMWIFAHAGAADRVEAAARALLRAGRFSIDRNGFANFPPNRAASLMDEAMRRAGVTGKRKICQPQARGWTHARSARLGYLIALGHRAKEIAEHPDIRSTPGAVQRQANRLGLNFSEAPRGQLTIALPRPDCIRLEAIARRRHMTASALVRRLAQKAEILVPIAFAAEKSDIHAL